MFPSAGGQADPEARSLDPRAGAASGQVRVGPPASEADELGGDPHTLAWLARVNRLALLSRLVATTLHDMNNALQVIGGGVELLQLQPVDIGAVTRAIGGKTDRANVLLQDLSRFMRDAGDAVEPVDLRALAEQALALRHFSLARLRIAATVEGEATTVPAVRREVLQVLLNLLVNAEAALRGHPSPALRLHIGATPNGAVLGVEDNGPGVPVDQRDGLFAGRRQSGDGLMSPLGIGLAVSRALVERRGGTLSFAPREPSGAAFTLTLPASGR